jgi:hypothetical protein
MLVGKISGLNTPQSFMMKKMYQEFSLKKTKVNKKAFKKSMYFVRLSKGPLNPGGRTGIYGKGVLSKHF